MKVLNISTIIPLKGVKRENDIVLKIQDDLSVRSNYEFKMIRPIPYIPKLLSQSNNRWKNYYKYRKSKIVCVNGYETLILSQFTLPTSNSVLKYFFLPLNWKFLDKNKRKLINYGLFADLIVSQCIFPDAVIAFWLSSKLNIPYVLNTRGLKKSFFYLYPLNFILKKSAVILTHSPTHYNKFKILNEKIKLIPHPVSERFNTSDLLKFSNIDTIHLVSCCRLLNLKNIDWVIRALSKFKNNNQVDFIYHVIGDGPMLKKLKDLVRKELLDGKVVFYGYLAQAKVIPILWKSHIFIMPSYPETLGRSFLEAAQSNCLIIGHEKTGVDGLFKEGESAIFVNNKNIDSKLASVFMNFSKGDYLKFVINAKKVTSKLTKENISDKYDFIYKGCLNRL